MKTLTNKTLIYDDDCPLCRAYTTGFVKAGMLDANGKKPYSQMQAWDCIDLKRAANEIALVDTANKKTVYGIDSLLTVLGTSFPWIEKTGRFAPVHFLLRKLYSFISYNRKVIMSNPKSAAARTECIPDFNLRYRIAYLAFASCTTGITLHAYSALLPDLKAGGLATELVLAAAQIFFQALFLYKYDFKAIVDYAGNLMTVSLFGALLLTPVLIAAALVPIPQFVALCYFALVAAIMFAEHWRRVDLLHLPKTLCFSWVAYRALFLFLLLTLLQ